MQQRRYRCPECSKVAGVKILYGYPSGKAVERAERQEVHLGGCCEEIGAPNRHCTACSHEWVSSQ